MTASETALALAADIEQLERALADSRAYAETLERRLVDAGEQLPDPPPPPLEVFPAVESIVWRKWPDEPATWKRFPEHYARVITGLMTRQQALPYRNVLIEGVGEVRRIGGKSSPDPVLILNHRCLDVTAEVLCAYVQNGDDSYESDPADMEWLAANYQGGLRAPLSSWKQWSQFAPYAEILADARPDIVVDHKANRLRLTPAG